MRKDILLLFTHEYPYGTGESFIENELNQHLKYFKTVKVLPLIKKGQAREINKNISVVDLYENIRFNSFQILKRNFFSFFHLIIKEFYYSKLKFAFLKQLPVLKSILLQNFKRAELLKDHLENEKNRQNIVFYSFWTDDWATILSILKKQNVITDFISRVHGYDLYAKRWPDSIIPFRNLHIESISKIFAVSKDGLLYLQKSFPQSKNKFYLNHLSIFDNGLAPFDDSTIFTIVSCSDLIPLKRVHLIADFLCLIGFNVKWVHFGDGVEKDEILSIIKKMPGNIVVELKGRVPNAEIIQYYKSNIVNLFIHLSETEGGVPLALQEAASFGIPLLGTNIGGIVEIVNAETGILVDKNIESEKLIEILTKFKDSPSNTIDFRNSVRKFWLDTFDAKTNYSNFLNLLTE